MTLSAASRMWVFSDVHGVRSALVEALQRAGLIDADEQWSAPPGTALVGCGDYLDRGTASRGVLELLLRLRRQAVVAGSQVVLLRGNHEQMVVDALRDHDTNSFDVWIANGGRQTLASYGLDPEGRAIRRGPEAVAAALGSAAAGLVATLAELPEWARWRDVLLCHAGPVAHLTLEQWPSNGWHLWQFPKWRRSGDPDWDLDSPAYAAYRSAGLLRFVYGHQPHDGPGLYQGGRILAVDTNACHARSPGFASGGAAFTLVRLPLDGTLGVAEFISVDTSSAPDRMPR